LENKKEKSFEKKQELIDAALEEFGEKGYDNASLNNILKVAGISKGTFYYHFPNKEELYMYLIGVIIEEKKTFLGNYVKAEDFNKDIFELFKILIKAGIEFSKSNPKLSTFSNRYLKEIHSPIHVKAMERYSFQRNDYFNYLIDNSFARGELREDLDKTFVRKMITYLFSNIQEITDVAALEDFGDVANNMVEFMKNGLGKKEVNM
jgi:TetR/AcrR family transcriptional regulator